MISLRTVERAVAHLRRELLAEGLATVRFETPPGRQLQIDFGERHGRRERSVMMAHLRGITTDPAPVKLASIVELPRLVPAGALQRPLAEYEQAAGGGW